MNYKSLRNYFIKLGPREEVELEAGPGAILIPPPNSKVFLHWLNDKGKLVSTYTLQYSTLVYNSIKIINGSTEKISIHVIEL